VTVDELFGLICQVAGKRLRARHVLDRPQGVRGRNSDNRRLRAVLGWEPQVPLEQGLAITYRWIEDQLRQQGRLPATEPLTKTASQD